MAKFIELPFGDKTAKRHALVNIDKIQEVYPQDFAATKIYFSDESKTTFTTFDIPYAKVRRMILTVTGQEDGDG
jgi:hypothetical protein